MQLGAKVTSNIPHHIAKLFTQKTKPAANARASSTPYCDRSRYLAQNRAPTASIVHAVNVVPVMRRSLWFAMYGMAASVSCR
jgi:hypothetical protein